jgi:hypothetical protein
MLSGRQPYRVADAQGPPSPSQESPLRSGMRSRQANRLVSSRAELMRPVQHVLASECFRRHDPIGSIACFADGLEALRDLPHAVSAGPQTALS